MGPSGLILALLTVGTSGADAVASETSRALQAATAPPQLPAAAGPVQDALMPLPDPWLPGTNRWGGRGGWHLDAAHPNHRGALLLGLGLELARSSGNPFGTAQANLTYREAFTAYRLLVTYVPVTGLEIGLAGELRRDDYITYVRRHIQASGWPTLNIKYSRSVLPQLGLGLLGTYRAATAVDDGSLAPLAGAMTLTGLLTYRLHPSFEATANLGYTHDRGHTLTKSDISPESRFYYQIDSYDRLMLGIGGSGRFRVGEVAGLGPFAEVTGGLPLSGPAAAQQLRASLGLRIYLLPDDLLQVSLGVDVRLRGMPTVGVPTPGLLPWTGFAMLGIRLFNQPAPPSVAMLNMAVEVAPPPPLAAAAPQSTIPSIFESTPGSGFTPPTPLPPPAPPAPPAALTGRLQGSLRHARTGAPVVAQVRLQPGNRLLEVNEAGEFGGSLPAGRYRLFVSGPYFRPIKARLEVRYGGITRLKLEMRPRPRPRPRR